MSDGSMKTDSQTETGMTEEEWKQFDALTDDEAHAAALSDPDNPPLTEKELSRMRRVTFVKHLRRSVLHVSRETFAERYGVPLDALIAWERHEAEPTPTEMTYLKLIEKHPEIVDLKEAAE